MSEGHSGLEEPLQKLPPGFLVEPTILNGVEDTDFPECGAIGFLPGRNVLGSCVLVSPRVAFTAAHVPGTPHVAFFNTAGPTITGTSAHEGSLRRKCGAGRGEADLAVFVLRNSLAAPAAAEIATAAEFLAAREVTVAGWGNDQVGATGAAAGAETRRKVTVPIVHLKRAPRDDLSSVSEALGFDPEFEFVVGDSETHKGACFGDSGGPVYIDVNGKSKLAGIVQGNVDGADGCQGLTVATRLDTLRSFWAPILANPDSFVGC